LKGNVAQCKSLCLLFIEMLFQELLDDLMTRAQRLS
jgi:hypothetical protein